MAKEKILINQGEGDVEYMAELNIVREKVQVLERDIGTIKDDQHKIMTSQSNLEIVFDAHCVRDDEKLNIIHKTLEATNKAVDGIKELCTTIVQTQNEQSRELLRVEMKSDYENLKQTNKALEEKIEDSNKGFWGKFKSQTQDWIIKGILALFALGITTAIAKTALIDPIIHAMPK